MSKAPLTTFAAGLVFALGLGLAGMTQPPKVLAFLDVSGAWDPSLALVMAGAIGVHFLALRLFARAERPLFDVAFEQPAARAIDLPLVGGAALFGLGWGISGFCPGPALVALATLAPGPICFVLAMLLGMTLVRRREPTACGAEADLPLPMNRDGNVLS